MPVSVTLLYVFFTGTASAQAPALLVSVPLLYAVSFIAALSGNAFVLYIIHRRRPRVFLNLLFVNRAVADLIVAAVAFPEGTAFYFRDYKWPGGAGGEMLCRAAKFAFPLAIAASIFTLIAMTVESYKGVVYPLELGRVRNPKKISAVIWASAMLLMSPRVLTFSLDNQLRPGDCLPDWRLFGIPYRTGETIVTALNFVLLLVLPLILMAILFSLMFVKIRQSGSIPGEPPNQQALRRSGRQSRKAARRLLAIVFVFTMCWIPVHIMHVLVLLSVKTAPFVMFLCFWCGQSHSAVSPWLYLLISRQLRQDFLVIIRCATNANRRRHPTGKTRGTFTHCNSGKGDQDTPL